MIALRFVNSSVYIAKSSFSYNHHGIWAIKSAVFIHQSNFTHNRKSAIVMTKSNVTSTEINVYHNRGIISGYMSKLIDKQSNFSNNNVTKYSSGLINCRRCIVNLSNSVISFNNGEIMVYSNIFWGTCRVSIVRSVVINNFGSITLKHCFHINIISSKLVNNVASGHAILSFESSNEIHIVENSFINSLVYTEDKEQLWVCLQLYWWCLKSQLKAAYSQTM